MRSDVQALIGITVLAGMVECNASRKHCAAHLSTAQHDRTLPSISRGDSTPHLPIYRTAALGRVPWSCMPKTSQHNTGTPGWLSSQNDSHTPLCPIIGMTRSIMCKPPKGGGGGFSMAVARAGR
jgi:hypothetical protein